jgi:CO/xanthine dehydrogenase FAD-binding subunit
MPVTITEYLRPTSLKEALTLLGEEPGRNIAVGGGVSVVLSGAPRRVRAVDLQRAGLHDITKADGELRLGAMASLEDVIRSPLAASPAQGLLVEGLRTAASESIRRLITVGGNIVQCYYWATLPPLLLALDARVHLRTLDHRRTLKASEFFARPPMRELAAGELVTDVTIPLKPARKAAFEKLARTSNDYALIQVAVSWVDKRGKVSDARVVVSACTSLPVRCTEVEAFLEGRAIDLSAALEAGQLAAHHVKLRGDFRASPEYRRRVLAVMVQRALLKAAQSEK